MRKSIFLSLLIALTAICSSCEDDSESGFRVPSLHFTLGDLSYTTNTNGTSAQVSGSTYNLIYQMKIPTRVVYNGKSYAVTSIGDSAFYFYKHLASIILPEGVTSIGNCAFAYTDLTSITIPKGVTAVEDSVFYSCTKLQEIYVCNSTPPSIGVDGLSGIDKSSCKLYVPFGSREAYAAAAGWKEFIHIEESEMVSITEFTVDNLMYLSNTSGTSVSVTGVVTKPAGQFTIPSRVTYHGKSYSVTSIGYGAFEQCIDLTSVLIPESVTSIGSGVFEKCINLTSVLIPESVTSIGYFAFRSCSALTSITIPSSVTSIGISTFSDCGLNSITISSGVTSIERNAFSNCSALTSITIPSSVTSIERNAFSNCSALTSITIPSSVTSIELGTFSDCSALTSITIPSSITSIGESAFSYCSALTSITIPSGVMSIGQLTFYDCSSLTSVTLPSSITSIGSYAFAGCSSLKEFYVNNSTPPSVGTYGLNDVYYTKTYKLYVPIGSKEAYAAADQWKDFMSIEEMNMNEE